MLAGMSEAELSFKVRLKRGVVAWLRDAAKTSYDLFKVMIPVIVVVRLLDELGAVTHLGIALAPVMRLVGLPGEMGLVWATALITNIYGGMVVFVQLIPRLADPLTVAQVTVLGTMILVAHGLPVECRICQKAGPRFRAMLLLRVLGALALGAILHQIYTHTGTLTGEAKVLWQPKGPASPAVVEWALGQLQTLGTIFLIILTLLLVMRLLKWAGVLTLMTWLLKPVLRVLGISRGAAPLAIIGMTLGLSYGGGLIIQEAKAGHLSKRDVFFSLALMSLCHSIIEDTLLLAALGAHHSGILWGRLVFALLVVFILVKLLRNTPEKTFDRWLFRADTAGGEER
jgi:hypothetical protein